ncbi:MAG: hypothetical protein ACLPVO_00370 [Desulfomonilaceae bacterium]
MNPNETKRPYRLKDVKRCFGLLSDAVILQWFKKGIISGAMIPRGSRSQFAFSFPEIVHIGVINDLAQFGLTTDAEHFKIGVTPNRSISGEIEMYPMISPGKWTEIYQQCSYDLCLTIDNDSKQVTTESKRNRSEVSYRRAVALSPLEAFLSTLEWISSGHLIAEGYVPYEQQTFQIKYAPRSGRVVIYVPNVAARTASALGVSNPWQRSTTSNDEQVLKQIANLVGDWR